MSTLFQALIKFMADQVLWQGVHNRVLGVRWGEGKIVGKGFLSPKEPDRQ